MTAVDITPAMLERCRRRADCLGVAVNAQVMDARQLTFEDEAFDAVVFRSWSLRSCQNRNEVWGRPVGRVPKPGGRVAVFDKFLGDEEQARRHPAPW